MPLYDYDCAACKSVFEAMAEVEQRRVPCPVCHKGTADRVYLKFGGMLGRNKGKYPRFDSQLGITIESAQHMEKVAKQRGLVPLGREEFDRSRYAPRTPDPLDRDEPDPELIEAAKRAWDDVKFNRLPPEVEEKRVMDVAADVLNVDDAKTKMVPTTKV
jgi:putative FmdB family regulatory protein